MPNIAKRVFSRLPMARSTRAYDFLFGHVALPSAPRLLDLGAGQGSGTVYISRRFPQATVLGLDINYECLKLEQSAIGPVPPAFVQGNGLALPLETGCLDGITAVMTFHCLPHPQQILKEAARALRPGGWIVIADVNGRHPLARPFEWFEHRFISPLTHSYTADEYQTLMSNAGLTDCRVEQRPGKENGFMLWVIAFKPQ